MKTLILIRHAKAGPGYGRDKDRALIERGHHNAAMMAKKLFDAGVPIGQLLCSPAARTKETAVYFKNQFYLKEEQVSYIDTLYLAEPHVILDVVQLYAAENVDSLAVIGHNPGISDAITALIPAQFTELPTSGIAVIKLDCMAWTDILTVHGKLVLIDSPKHQGNC